uniref:Nudix hydrolase domain-containing protein n=1 Tax=Globisporangium ultimum (strain ATCC 200006 / CBS 805.95 / DAOM BR144) TaxID=431595 RepID=K3W4Z8_GLOUD
MMMLAQSARAAIIRRAPLRWPLHARSLSTKPPNEQDDPQERLPRVTSQETVFENPWLRLKTIHFVDAHGRARHWTGLERTTTYPTLGKRAATACNSGIAGDSEAEEEKCDAVVVFPFLTQQGAAHQVILIRQFRPPVGNWVVELPAGLIDGDEAPEIAAYRELKEETGYVASKVLHMGPPMVNDQGITNGKCRLVLMEVKHEDQLQEKPTQQLEDDEMIQVLHAPLDRLIPWLMERKVTAGDAIDARLYSYALGLQALPAALGLQR